MKLLSVTALAFCLVSEVFAGPIPLEDELLHTLDKRATIQKAPSTAPHCNGFSVSVAGINSALQQGANLASNNAQKGKNSYPHQFKNTGNQFSWANCPPADQHVFYEYPVLRNSPNPWLPGSKTKLGSSEPDRVIWQANSATTATYCGVITHSGASAAGQFKQCT